MLIEYMTWNGKELANAARTETYARSFSIPWFLGCNECGTLGSALHSLGIGPEAYHSPQQDHPSWYDVDNPDTWGFFGFYPLSVSGVDDSTRYVDVTPRTRGGASVGRIVYGPREMVVRGLLIGIDQPSVQEGLNWLNNLFADPVCDPNPLCVGATVTFFNTCPVLCDDNPTCADDCAMPYLRTLYDVTVTSGPTVLSQYNPLEGGLIEVEFTMTAGNPHKYGQRIPIWDPNGLVVRPTYGPFSPEDFGDDFDTGNAALGAPPVPPLSYTWTNVGPGSSGGSTVVDPKFADPDCPAPPAFPGYPQQGLGCNAHTGSWKRLTIPMEAEKVPEWARSLPVIQIAAGNDHHDVRVTFDRGGQQQQQFLVNWLPGGATINLDGTRDEVTMTRGQQTISAEHLVTADRAGNPFRWPIVSCGEAFKVYVDVPSTESTDDIDVTLFLHTRDG